MGVYVKQNFESGQILKAEHLNHMEDGIENLSLTLLTEEQVNELIDAKMASLVNAKEVEY